MNRRWVCNDVWMDIFPSFDRPQLGLKLALLSPRFNALVDKHFDGKSELTIWRPIEIRRKDSVTASAPEFHLFMDDANSVTFPLPDDRPLPSKIRFKCLHIEYIDHSVIAFLRLNHQIFDKRGTDLQLWIPTSHNSDDQPIWDIFVREIWPIFSTNIRRLGFTDGDLNNLRRLISPTILTDLLNLNSIDLLDLFPDSIAIGDGFDGPNGTNGQVLSKWLHSPRKDGQPKRMRCCKNLNEQGNFKWINNFKEHFLRANAISSVSYQIHFIVRVQSVQMVPFELVNELTKEKLTLAKAKENDLDKYKRWIMKRCKIRETATDYWEDVNWTDLNNVFVWLFSDTNCIGTLSAPPPAEETGQSITNGSSSDK